VAGSRYTLDVNPTSANRVKVRLYETRSVEAGGNILLVQGQLSLKQFRALEELVRAGAASSGAELVSAGRYYALPRETKGCGVASDVSSSMQGRCATSANSWNRGLEGLGPGPRQRTPGITGPVIGPDGVEDDDDDYETLALRHVHRMLRRKAGSAL
jgi:hypothetical protein